jgi:hypothetical protein
MLSVRVNGSLTDFILSQHLTYNERAVSGGVLQHPLDLIKQIATD